MSENYYKSQEDIKLLQKQVRQLQEKLKKVIEVSAFNIKTDMLWNKSHIVRDTCSCCREQMSSVSPRPQFENKLLCDMCNDAQITLASIPENHTISQQPTTDDFESRHQADVQAEYHCKKNRPDEDEYNYATEKHLNSCACCGELVRTISAKLSNNDLLCNSCYHGIKYHENHIHCFNRYIDVRIHAYIKKRNK